MVGIHIGRFGKKKPLLPPKTHILSADPNAAIGPRRTSRATRDLANRGQSAQQCSHECFASPKPPACRCPNHPGHGFYCRDYAPGKSAGNRSPRPCAAPIANQSWAIFVRICGDFHGCGDTAVQIAATRVAAAYRPHQLWLAGHHSDVCLGGLYPACRRHSDCVFEPGFWHALGDPFAGRKGWPLALGRRWHCPNRCHDPVATNP